MNYGQLKAAIANRLSRTNLTAIIPDFITLGESRLYAGFRDIEVNVPPLRLIQMLTSETASLAALPTGFLELHRFTVPSGSYTRALEYITPEQMAGRVAATNWPLYYTFQDGGVKVEGGTPASFTFSYYKRFNTLVADADTNWLLENHPGIYLYSALIEAYAHIKDDSRLPMAGRMYAAAANALIDSDNAAKHSGSVLSIGAAR
jgi:hypothetical protein